MKFFHEWLNEKRKNPELNPKIGRIEALRPYKDREDCYISFTEINKLGINPNNIYGTPTGLYSYPLKAIWDQIENDSIPFAANRPYIQLFSCSHPKLQECSMYYFKDLKSDVKKLEKILPKKYGKELDKVVLPYGGYKKWLNMIFEDSETQAYNDKPFTRFWYITMTLSITINDKRWNKYGKLNSQSMHIWNSILSEVGYVGFTDKKGIGYIHINEPIQAMFLSKKHIKHIDTILNKKYEENVSSLINVQTIDDILTQFKRMEKDNKLDGCIALKDLTEALFEEDKIISLSVETDIYRVINRINMDDVNLNDFIKMVQFMLNSDELTKNDKIISVTRWEHMIIDDEYQNKNLFWKFFEWYIRNTEQKVRSEKRKISYLENYFEMLNDLLENGFLTKLPLKTKSIYLNIKIYLEDRIKE